MYAIARDGKYLKWIWNSGVRNDNSPVPDFMHWTDDLEAAKLWKMKTNPTFITDLHNGMEIVEVVLTTAIVQKTVQVRSLTTPEGNK